MAYAQTGSVASQAGLQPNRDYLALQPFEAIDTASGQLMLRFDDLVLPGNNGRDLRFERVYNASTKKWTFGIAGLPLRVVQPAISLNLTIPDTIVDNRIAAPTLFMSDGSEIKTTFMEPPDTSNPNTLLWVSAPNFWKYHRGTRTLYLTDGRVAQYDELGRLANVMDQFANWLFIGWGPDSLTVTQTLGNEQSRQVVIAMDHSTHLPTTMTYDGRVWTYVYQPTGSGTPVQPGRLERVETPEGQVWVFEYEDPTSADTALKRVTTPYGGRVTYAYAWRVFQTGENPQLDQDDAYVLDTRIVDGPWLTPGTWRFDYNVLPGGVVAGIIVTLPSSGVKVGFSYAIRGAFSASQVLSGAWTLINRLVWAPDGTPIGGEDLTYRDLRAARTDRDWVVPQLEKRQVTRDGRTYTTDYVYDSSFTNFHHYHRPIRVIETGVPGELNRTTVLTYQHLTTLDPYIVGLPLTEQATVDGGETIARAWSYNAATGFRQSETAYGMTTTFAPDAVGNVSTITRANGTTTQQTFSYGQVATVTTAEHQISRVINPDGTVASETSGGRTTVFGYDDLGRVELVDPPVGASIVTNYASGVTTTRGNSQTITTLDGFGRPVRTVVGSGATAVTTETDYDAQGRMTYQSLPFTGTRVGTAFSYDFYDRVTREEHTGGAHRTYAYAGNTVTVTDENGHDTVLTRKAYGHPDDARLTALTDPAGEQWNYSYNAFGSVTQVAGPGGITRTWQYNGGSPLLRAETHPESGTVTYDEYDAAGLLKKKTDAKGQVTTFAYDGNDRLRTATSGTQLTEITYEPGSDNRATMTVNGVSTVFTYDAGGRLQTRTDTVDGKAFRIAFDYDANDNVELITYPSGRQVKYAYGPENQVMRVFNPVTDANYAAAFSYHPSGALTGYTAGNGMATTIAYDPNRYWVTSISAGEMQFGYSNYDGVGNVRSITDARTALNQTFSYDTVDRLASATGAYGSSQFDYDAHGNRQVPGMYVYEPGSFRLKSIDNNVTPMTYDDNGNLKTGSNAQFWYTPDNLMDVSLVGGTTTRFAYDADTWRVKKSVDNGPTTYYVRGPNGELLMEWVNTSPVATVREYIYAGSRLIAVTKGDVPPK